MHCIHLNVGVFSHAGFWCQSWDFGSWSMAAPWHSGYWTLDTNKMVVSF